MIVAGVGFAVLFVGLAVVIMIGGMPRRILQSPTLKNGRIEGNAWINNNSDRSSPLRGLHLHLLKTAVDGEMIRSAYRDATERLLRNMKALVEMVKPFADSGIYTDRDMPTRVKLYTKYAIDSTEIINDSWKEFVAQPKQNPDPNVKNSYDMSPVFDVLDRATMKMTLLEVIGKEPSADDRRFLSASMPFQFIVDKTVVMETDSGVDATYKFSDVPAGRYYLYAHYESSNGTVAWLIPVEIKDGSVLHVDLHNGTARAIH